MRFNLLLIQIFGVTLSILLLTSFFLVGCGAFEEDNSQPSIEPITDEIVSVGDTWKVRVYITDDDVDDTHIIMRLLTIRTLLLFQLMRSPLL